MELVAVGGLAATSLYFRLTIEKRKKNKIKRQFQELMQELKLCTKESKITPKVLEVEFIENGFILDVKIPTGLELKKIEDVQEAIENKFEGLVFIEKERFSNIAKIKIVTKDIGKFIYDPVKAESFEIFIGKTFDGEDYLIDVNKDSHLLIGGATGTGKSFLLGTILINLIYNSSDEIELHLGQILKGELGLFKNCNPVKFASEDLKEIADDLNKVAKIIDIRSKYFSKLGIKNLKHYNKHFNDKKINRIFYVIEELSFFMPSSSDIDEVKELKNKCWDSILTIVKAGRSSGVHLIALTQRSTVSNLPSDVKSQMCRISFKQISSVDSKNIIECDDALNLKDRECLIYCTSKTMEIVKTPWVDEDFKILSKYVKEIITPGDYIITSEIEELEGLLNNIDVEVLKDIEEQEKNNLEPKETVANNKSKKKTKKGMIKVDCTEDFEE
ncbi:FtsK/SpoIIIE domain-containing protein [Clostridium sp.]|uniref:FtsK/SpoIIIE domain-containing protein n=1 Tax=Clostridium sp. TaxID=1506 RepID=UPI00290E5A3D|nr:FtsK/SpoIIIE domain-containing protein [Clostridium sp.]MDU7363894.1 FtsK/SpoIIIE domain-containing protein [Clostridium sp.]